MEPAMPLPVKETIADLGNSNKPLRNSRLVDLSNLNSEELKLFQPAWANIEPKRRRQIIYWLVELSEDNFELDFDSIFRNCLSNPSEVIRQAAEQALYELEAGESPFAFTV